MSIILSRASKNSDSFINARNQTGVTLTKGTLLYISGYDLTTTRFLVATASSDDPVKAATYVSDVDIPNNSNGAIYPSRYVINLDTSSATSEGDPVYLGLNGAFVIGGTAGQRIGTVTKKHASTGEIRFVLTGGVPNNFVGDSGTGGTRGHVPAPAAGDGALRKVLSASGIWSIPAAPVTVNKNMTPVATTGNNAYTSIQISSAPISSSYVKVEVNGVGANVGNGTNSLECYFASNIPYKAVQGGGNSSVMALRSDGSLWGWGDNSTASIGDNSLQNRSSPVSVVGNHSFASIMDRYGGLNSFALKADGSAWGWGNAITGSVGDNTNAAKSSPTSVVGAHSFVDVRGHQGGIGLKVDGSLWIWGVGGQGQIGNNANTNRSSPISVLGAHNFVFVAGGLSNVQAIKGDGSLWSWGDGGGGINGDNSTTARSSPVSVVGAHMFTQVYVGNGFSLAMKSNGTAWAWGTNVSGFLGDNTTTARSSPVSVVGNHSFAYVFINIQTCYGVKADNSIWAWGSNPSGEFGDNTAGTSRSSPISVVVNNAIARSFGSVLASDHFVWNGINAGTNLSNLDRVDFHYS